MTLRPSALFILLPLVLGPLIAGCSGGPSPLPSLTTGSLFGAKAAAPPVAPVPPANTPVNRAFQVGSVSARAVKCGFNFDAEGLKSRYLASEAQTGANVEDVAKAEKIYRVSFNGVMKAASDKDGYCNELRTKQIKGDLALLLAGDFTPQLPRARIEEENTDAFQFGSVSANNPFQ